MAQFHWRPMQAGDLDEIVSVAALAFPDHFEARACFEQRLALFPQGCFVLASTAEVMGYLIAYPQAVGTIPALNSSLDRLGSQEAVYLHDLALHPEVRGRGFSVPMVERLFDDLRLWGTRKIHLVAVNTSLSFWQKLGFVPVENDLITTRQLESYSGEPTYMIRDI